MDPASDRAPLNPSRRGRPPRAGLRRKILSAAELVFTRHDYHEVLMEEVARESGVGKGTLYCYFPSKQDLYLTLMFDGIERLHTELRAALDQPDRAPRKIERIVRCILGTFWHRRHFFALIHRNEHMADAPAAREWLRRRAQISRVIQRTLEEGVAQGSFRQMDARIAAEMLLGMIRGANRYRTRRDRLESLVAAVVELFLDGLREDSARPSLARRNPEE